VNLEAASAVAVPLTRYLHLPGAFLVVREDELVSLERDGAMLSSIARRVGMLVCCCALRSSILESNLLGEGPWRTTLSRGFRSLVASKLGFAEFLGRWFVRSRFCGLHRL